MADGEKDQSRVGRLTYWMYYLALTVSALFMYAFGAYEFLKLHLFPIVFGFLAPTIMWIYLRVIASRRCRDIGWPAILPWLGIALMAVCVFFSGMAAGSNPAAALVTMGASTVVIMLVGAADFVFLIVIGCIAGADDSSDPFANGRSNHGDVTRAPQGYVDGYDTAMARRARPLPQAFGDADAPHRAAEPSGMARPAASFGRRAV